VTHTDLSGPSGCSLSFLWINTHTLSNTTFNISPFFPGAFHASANVHDAFFFSFTETVYQTHCISSFLLVSWATARSDALDPISRMLKVEGWKLLDFFHLSLRSKPL